MFRTASTIIAAAGIAVAAPCRAQVSEWRQSPADGNFHNPSNWTGGLPTVEAAFGPSQTTALTLTNGQETTLQRASFTAPAYEFRVTGGTMLRLAGAGVLGGAADRPSFLLPLTTLAEAGQANRIRFSGSASAGSGVYRVENGRFHSPVEFIEPGNARLLFEGSSSAGSAQVFVHGRVIPQLGDSLDAVVAFVDNATAADSTITLDEQFGENYSCVFFAGNATAGNAVITVEPGMPSGGRWGLVFRDQATGGTARVTNHGSTAFFGGNADRMRLDNHGSVRVLDASLGSAVVDNHGYIGMEAGADAGAATINNIEAPPTSGLPVLDAWYGASLGSASVTSRGVVSFGRAAHLGTASVLSTVPAALEGVPPDQWGDPGMFHGGLVTFSSVLHLGDSTIDNRGLLLGLMDTGPDFRNEQSPEFFVTAFGRRAAIINRGIIDLSRMTNFDHDRDAAGSGATAEQIAAYIALSFPDVTAADIPLGADRFMYLGSLSGPGIVHLGGAELRLGTLGRDDVIGGPILTGSALGEVPGDTLYTPPLSGGTLTKLGAGTLTLAGASTYTGSTNAEAGSLFINGSVASAANRALSGAVFGGDGSVDGSLSVRAGGTLSPGPGHGAVGSLHVSAASEMRGGSSLVIDIRDAASGPGVGWDLLTLSGNLNFTSTPGVTVRLRSQNPATAGPGPAGGFGGAAPGSWLIIDGSSSTVTNQYPNFNAAAFTIDTSAFLNPFGGVFSIRRDGRMIFLDYTPGCPADFNQSGAVSVQDIFDFLEAYFSNDPLADFNVSGVVSVQDIFDFLAAYFAGCS